MVALDVLASLPDAATTFTAAVLMEWRLCVKPAAWAIGAYTTRDADRAELTTMNIGAIGNFIESPSLPFTAIIGRRVEMYVLFCRAPWEKFRDLACECREITQMSIEELQRYQEREAEPG